MKQMYFVAGTDTGVGKTFTSCVMLKAAEQKALRTLALKPVSAGCDLVELANGKTQWQNEDALALMEHMSVKLPYVQVNPVALEVPASPHIAAALESKTVRADRIVGYCRGAMMTPADFVLIEGAGGWRVPISPTETMADIAKQLEIKVILVVALRLGCLNHALLTAEAIRKDGLEIVGWVGNRIDDQTMGYEDLNISTLKSALAAPCLGILPYTKGQAPSSLVDQIDLDLLTVS
ncbi:MAG: dethiobiotin synthetase [Oleiphilaceae bacterium]|jgi:dethiobiotin synthetase